MINEIVILHNEIKAMYFGDCKNGENKFKNLLLFFITSDRILLEERQRDVLNFNGGN